MPSPSCSELNRRAQQLEDQRNQVLVLQKQAEELNQATTEKYEKQLAEGSVLAPTSGRVLKVPVTPGTVVLPGEPVAMIAEQNYVLRLRVPERHARFLKAGDPVRLEREDRAEDSPRFGAIRLVYPQIEDGRVVADATVQGLGDYFVGERIRVQELQEEAEVQRIPLVGRRGHQQVMIRHPR